MEKERIYKLIIAILLLAVVLVVLYFAVLPKYLDKEYQKGFEEGVNGVIQQIITTNSVPLVITTSNSTQVQWIPIQSICGGANAN